MLEMSALKLFMVDNLQYQIYMEFRVVLYFCAISLWSRMVYENRIWIPCVKHDSFPYFPLYLFFKK